MARLYANENFPCPVVEGLKALGHDVLSVQDTGQAGRAWPDEEVLRFAVAEARAVLTLNRRHFVRLHGDQPGHRGIVVCSFDADFERQARSIHEALVGTGTLDGRLIRVNRPG